MLWVTYLNSYGIFQNKEQLKNQRLHRIIKLHFILFVQSSFCGKKCIAEINKAQSRSIKETATDKMVLLTMPVAYISRLGKSTLLKYGQHHNTMGWKHFELYLTELEDKNVSNLEQHVAFKTIKVNFQNTLLKCCQTQVQLLQGACLLLEMHEIHICGITLPLKCFTFRLWCRVDM